MLVYGHIYLVTNQINGKVYVGQTTRPPAIRWIEHCSKSKDAGSNNHFHNAVQRYGESAFTFKVIDRAFSKEELDSKEQLYIELLDSTNKARGYNTFAGGQSLKMTDQIKQKISKSLTGKKLSPEHRQSLSDAQRKRWADASPEARSRVSELTALRNTKRILSIDTKRKMGAANRGRIHTDEHRAKVGAASRAMWADPDFRERMIQQRAMRGRGADGRFLPKAA